MAQFTVRLPSGRVGNFLAGAAVASVIGGTAVAITSPDFVYSSAKVGFYAIHPMDLTAATGSTGYSIIYSPPSLTGNGCLNTGIHLPQGASILNIDVYYISDTESDPVVYFDRLNLRTSVGIHIVAHELLSDNVRSKDSIPIPAAYKTVNNGDYAYGFAFCVNSGSRFYDARIRYTYTSAGD